LVRRSGRRIGRVFRFSGCKDRIANFKIPKKIEVWPDLPRGSTGKILKRAIIDMKIKAESDASGKQG